MSSSSGGALPADQVRRLVARKRVRQALDYLRETETETIADQIAACEIPAPPFGEKARGRWCLQRFSQVGLVHPRCDAVGNVLAEWPGVSARPLVVLAAHLDTVFPEGTEVRVRREGKVLQAPGIGDNARGLAVILAVARALGHVGIATRGTLLFVGNVGEEGLGDLRGTRHLLQGELAGRVDYFLTVDDAG
ncbi:MAG: M20/M25/M40 family metallo-hydrolase, partial [Armatimonadota bacterium]|nr:M20/M25/M40 family metallo-hydrolase [Armatimonadota bacterium]